MAVRLSCSKRAMQIQMDLVSLHIFKTKKRTETLNVRSQGSVQVERICQCFNWVFQRSQACPVIPTNVERVVATSENETP